MVVKFLIRRSITCSCGERWAILATQYDYNFDLRSAAMYTKRVLHRIYDCPNTTAFTQLTKDL